MGGIGEKGTETLKFHSKLGEYNANKIIQMDSV